jgi:hypothetical protein
MKDKFEDFLDDEILLNLSPKDTIERIRWYYIQFFKQTEISDEEIEKAAKEYDIKSTRWGAKTIFIDAIKWYKEQLKLRK